MCLCVNYRLTTVADLFIIIIFIIHVQYLREARNAMHSLFNHFFSEFFNFICKVRRTIYS